MLLESFKGNSWGSAYLTIAEVQVLLTIGKRLGMVVNLARHYVTYGTYLDGDQQKRYILFGVLGWHINGQKDGTWVNKLTFFFAVYHFLHRTGAASREALGDKLWEAREAMQAWGVSHETPTSFLGPGAGSALPSRTKLHTMIKQYMVSRLYPD